MAWLEKFWFGCGGCQDPTQCPVAKAGGSASDGDGGADLQGLRLVVPVMAVFLLPLIVAIGGAYAAGHWWADASFASLGRWQTGGAVVGLLVGVGLAKLLLGWMGDGRKSPGGQV